MFHSLTKLISKLGNGFGVACMLLFALLPTISVKAATTISFKLDEPCRTSAGVYKSDGTLVRTLWSNVRYYAAGTYTTNWDGKDDSGNPVSSGTYLVKVLQHNVQYVWDGVVGNTSYPLSGYGIHRGFEFIHDLSMYGANAFYCSGYNEGQFGMRMFNTNSPQVVSNMWYWDSYVSGNPSIVSSPGQANRNWDYTTADTNRVYFACGASYNSANGLSYGSPGCIVCSRQFDQAYTNFSSGIVITNNGDSIPNGIRVGTQPGLSGLAVQQNGNVLEASVAPDNKAYLFDKTTGAALTPASFSLNAAGRSCFATNNDLWIVNSNSVQRWTGLTTTPTLAQTITTGLAEPLAVSVSPINTNYILVADGGNSQQVKAFDASGDLLWIYGQAGGYLTNGPAVANNKFWFRNTMDLATRTNQEETFITFAPDGQSFWVGDEWNDRIMHFDTNLNYLEQIMYQPASYSTTVDKINPSRVFNNFLEFSVDYTKPLSNAWTLVNNWNVRVDTNHFVSCGFYGLQTFSNGRTYALIDNVTNRFGHNPNQMVKELCELVPGSGVRFTYTYPGEILGISTVNSFNTNGDILNATANGNHWYSSPLTGFNGNNNPVWGTQVTIATAPIGGANPMNQNIETFKTTPITGSGYVICFDDGLGTNYHLGGIAYNGSGFKWKASPSGSFFDGHGIYEISNGLTYAGSDVQAIGHNIVFGYHGEFFRGQGQAGQHFHYYDDGLFVGQFGESGIGYPAASVVPSFVGNAFGPVMISTNGEYYIYQNDESAHGSQRWHLLNAQNIREAQNSVTLNGSITLTNPPISFPIDVYGAPLNGSVSLVWTSVPSALSYNIYYSTNNGGPFGAAALSTPSSHAVVSGLSNGLNYYFRITSIVGGIESVPSEQIAVTPFDTSKSVIAVGHQITQFSFNNYTTYGNGHFVAGVMASEIDSNAPALGNPSFINTIHMANTLTTQDEGNYGFGSLMNNIIGTKGYVLLNWEGAGTNLEHFSSPITITVGSGWASTCFFLRQFYVSGKQEVNPLFPNYGIGLQSNPLGSINIGVGDTNYHIVTVVSGAISANSRNFTITLTSTNGDSAKYVANDNLLPQPNDRPQSTHIFQFVFRGNSVLTVDSTGGANGGIQAMFFDDVMATTSSALSPPAQFHTIGP